MAAISSTSPVVRACPALLCHPYVQVDSGEETKESSPKSKKDKPYFLMAEFLYNHDIEILSQVSRSCGFCRIRNNEEMWKTRAIVQLTLEKANSMLTTYITWRKVCLSLSVIGISSPPRGVLTRYRIERKGIFKAGLLEGDGKKTETRYNDIGVCIETITETGMFENDKLHGQGKSKRTVSSGEELIGRFHNGIFQDRPPQA